MNPFLDLSGFTALWDGPPLTTRQNAIVTLLLNVASQWIYNNGPQRTEKVTQQEPPEQPAGLTEDTGDDLPF